ncbi:hypothetical protein [Staphylococcus hominis]|uniref:hypothetical protein n=2 Tax=Staphylococcus hominis TaxID=1290 RepID=UPI00129455DB|nr:hypothetical protein [Staphylococcus hominis]
MSIGSDRMPRVVTRNNKKYYRMIVTGKRYHIPLEKLDYANKHGITEMAIRNRLRYGWTIERAVTEGIIDD